MKEDRLKQHALSMEFVLPTLLSELAFCLVMADLPRFGCLKKWIGVGSGTFFQARESEFFMIGS